MNDTCNRLQQLLSEQRDRTLTGDEQASLRAHLVGCPGCRAFDRDLRAGMTGIARLPRVSGSSDVREAVLAGVHPGGRSAWPRGWRDWTGQTLKIGGAVTAFALVAILLMTVFDTSGTGEPDEHLSGTGSQPSATSEPVSTPGKSVQPCVPGQVELSVETTEYPGNPASNDPEAVAFAVQAVKSTGGAQCRLTTPISLVLTDWNGSPLAIEGNPAMVEIDAVLGPEVGSVVVPWLNWCGGFDGGPFTLTVDLVTSSDSTTGVNEQVEITPPCADDSWPSLLGTSAIEAWLFPANTESDPDVSSCSGRSNILTEPEADTEGSLRVWFVIAEEGDCGDNGPAVRLRLENLSGGLLDIEGNDANLTLQPHPTGDFKWVGLRWTNWCGKTSGIKLEATAEGSGMGTYADEMPACVDDSQSSRLTVLDIPPPDDPWMIAPPIAPVPGTPVEPPVCDPETLHLTLLPMPAPSLYIVIEGSANKGSEASFCTVDAGELTVTITDANGQLLPVDRNGETFANDPYGSGGIVWHNWCGEEGPFTITVTIADRPLTLEVTNGPECIAEGGPSIVLGPNENGVTQGP